MGAINLDKLKQEIDSRKELKVENAIAMGEQGKAIIPKLNLLQGLAEAATTGRPNAASNSVAHFSNKVDEFSVDPVTKEVIKKSGGMAKHLPVINESPIETNNTPVNTVQQTVTYKPPQTNLNEDSREDGLYAEIERRTREYRRDIPNFQSGISANKPSNQINNTQQGSMLNEGVIIENLEKRIMSNINETFAVGIKDLFKSTIAELYTIDKIKNVLIENPDITKKVILENKEMFKGLIIDVIRELQSKNKK